MNTIDKQPTHLGNKDVQNRKTDSEHSSPSVPELLREISPSIKTYLRRSAKSQRMIAEAEMKFADAFHNLAEHVISGKQHIKLNFYGSGQRKRSKKSNDPLHRKVRAIIVKMRQKNKTYEEIAQQLKNDNIPTFTNRGEWHAQTVHRLFKDYLE